MSKVMHVPVHRFVRLSFQEVSLIDNLNGKLVSLLFVLMTNRSVENVRSMFMVSKYLWRRCNSDA